MRTEEVGRMAKVPQREMTGRVGVLAVVVSAGVLGVAGWWLLGHSEPVPWSKPATVDGSLLRLTYIGSECRDGADAEVKEDSTRVVVTVRETVRARSCSDVGVPYDLDVLLDAPLGGRELVDGACQMPAYASYIDCRQEKSTVEASAS
jgi:hypothetical protein